MKAPPTNRPASRSARLAQVRRTVRTLDPLLERFADLAILLETDPGAKSTGARDDLLPSVDHVVRTLTDFLDMGDELKRALRRPASTPDLLQRLEHLFSRDRSRCAAALDKFYSARLRWLLFARHRELLSGLVSTEEGPYCVQVASEIPAGREELFAGLISEHRDLWKLRVRYQTLIPKLRAHIEGPGSRRTQMLAKDLECSLAPLARAQRALCAILFEAISDHCTPTMLGATILQQWPAYEAVGPRTQLLAERIAEWMRESRGISQGL